MEPKNLFENLPPGWHVVYSRLSKQRDAITGKWVDKTFYIRTIQGARYYGEITDNGLDRLILVGIFNHDTGQYQDFAYSDKKDMPAFFEAIFKNFVKVSERKRVISVYRAKLAELEQHWLEPYRNGGLA
jgi:hypothetical protein